MRLLRRALTVLLAVVLAFEALYLVAANVYLNTPLASRTINRKPDRFTIRWRAAWTLWPGTVSLRGVEVRGESRRLQWFASIESLAATYEVAPLLRRTVHLKDVHAAGVGYRQRRRLLPGETRRFPESDLPPIPGLPGVSERPAEPPGAAVHHGQPWTILADRIVCDVDQLWFDRIQLKGPMRVETPMSLVVRGPMEFRSVRATMSRGDLLAGGEPIFMNLALDVDARIDPFVPKNARKLAFFRFLSGRFAFHSDNASLFFLDAYFRKTPWLRFNDRAKGQIEMLLDHGRLMPGSALAIENDHVDMQILDRRLTGRGTIRGSVAEAESGRPVGSGITARLDEFELSEIGGSKPYVRGHSATLTAASNSMDLSDPFTDLKVVFDLPRSEILDLTFYNKLIPDNCGFKILSGTGTMRYHIEGSHEERSLHGDIEIVVKNAVATFENYEVRGSFKLTTPLRDGSPLERRFDISGTRFESHADKFDWDGVITFPRAVMQFTEPMQIDAAIGLDLQDTRPLVALFDAFKGVPDWLEHMMIIEEIKGGARLDVRRDQVGVADLDVTGKGLHALADLALGKERKEGILYVRFHGFSLGIELKSGGKDLKLIRPLHWFETERARRGGPARGVRN